MSALLAWTPLLQPAPGAERWWWLLALPTALCMAVSYSAIRAKDATRIPRDSLVLAAQILAAIVGIAVGLHLIVVVLLPHLPAE
jgi:hypothetical protein